MLSRTVLCLIVGLLTLLSGCGKFKAGNCIQHVKDGFIYRITNVSLMGGYTVQGWYDGKWGVPVDASDLSFANYVQISCPFSTKTLR